MEGARVSAVIFDLDGTILDTERGTKNILKDFLAKYGKVVDLEKEEKRFGKMQKETAPAIIKDYGLPMTVEEFSSAMAPLYQERWREAKTLPGANRLIRHLHKHGVPLALASNSVKRSVETKVSYQKGWKDTFSVILGGDEVNQGKPSPDVFLEAAKRLGVDIANCLVIEDSPVGVTAAKTSGAKVVAVPSLKSQADHYSVANCVLHSLLEFQPELWGLPAFEDWVKNALPIEPLHIRGLIGDGAPRDGCTVLNIIGDCDSYASVPDQISGVFIGWVKLEKHMIFKAVVSTGWEVSSDIAKRVTKCHLLGHVNKNYTSKEKCHLLLIGYIRKLHDEETMSEALTLTEEDEHIAEAALDLPIFVDHLSSHLLLETDFREGDASLNGTV